MTQRVQRSLEFLIFLGIRLQLVILATVPSLFLSPRLETRNFIEESLTNRAIVLPAQRVAFRAMSTSHG